jgi:hypothetical protein
MKKLLATLAFGAAVLPLLTGSAFAHGCHRDVEEGRSGLHRHIGRDCDRIAVRRGEDERREFRGRREHEHEHDRAPQCVKKCQYVGPFKQCDTICR